MACTQPKPAQRYVCPTTGLSAVRLKNFKGEPELLVPCGKCLSCKLHKAREWAVRCWHESQMHEHSAYVTFTYAPEHLPAYGQLRHKDFQLFMKRLRKKYPDKGITYFMCGEYGDGTHRPHYHALLFGYYPPDAAYHRTENGNRFYKSQELDALWQCGFTDTSSVSYKSSGYIARYTLKKQLPSEDLQDRYTYVDAFDNLQTKPFEYIRMSTGRDFGQGIGGKWIEKYWQHTLENDYVLDPDGNKLPVPKYYLDILKTNVCADTAEKNRLARVEKAQDSTDNSPDARRQRAICVKARTKQLIRPYL